MRAEKHKIIKYIRCLICLVLIIFLLQSCKSCGYDAGLGYASTSPQGTNSIIVKYDFASRPSIFKPGLLWDKKIWQYKGAGFMETVGFEAEWLSENQIRFTYDDVNDKYDEEYIITIPD